MQQERYGCPYTWADPNNPGTSFSLIAREPKLIGAAIAMLIILLT
jgi:hypothetical protein